MGVTFCYQRELAQKNNFFLTDDEGPRVCCSADQLKTLDKNMGLPRQLLGRCPSCLRNFLDFYCYFTCAPDQSLFMSANKTESYKGNFP